MPADYFRHAIRHARRERALMLTLSYQRRRLPLMLP